MKPSPAVLILGLLIFATCTAQAQTNDSFAGRLTLTGTAATAVSNNLRATREPGEPNHAGAAGTRSLWWTWTAPSSGTVNFSTFGGGAAPSQAGTNAAARSLAVYTGDTLATLSEVASLTTLNRTAASYPQISGVPAGPSLNVAVTAGTVYQIAVDGAAAQSAADDGTVVLSINQGPTIYSAAGASGTVGAAFAYTVQASNNPTSFAATDLPTGLSINAYTGDITGMPQAAGTCAVHLSATNPGGTGVGTLTLTVGNAPAAASLSPQPPIFLGSAGASGTVGAAFSDSLVANGNATSYTASNLPGGLSLDTTYGKISGTPTVAGAFNVPVTATNTAGTGHATISINIAAAPAKPVITSSLAARGTAGSSFYYTIITSDSSGVAKPTSYGASDLPPGLGIDSTTGSIQGTPTAAGIYSVPISASNATGAGNAVVTVTVAASAAPTPQAAAPLLTSSAVASGAAGTAFSYSLTAMNTPTSFTADNLPPGLGINAQTGYITGTPANTGVYLVPVTAANAYGSGQATLTLTVTAPASGNGNGTLIYTSGNTAPPVITSAASTKGYVGQEISYQIYQSSAYSSYGTTTYQASGLPPGLSLNATSGYISGTPTTAGTYSVPIAVWVPYSAYYTTGTTIQYATGSAVVTFVIGASVPPVSAAPVVTSAAASSGAVVGSAFSGYTLAASNAPAGYSASNLPPGLVLDATRGAITGTPTTAGSYPVAVTATNSVGTGNATVTFIVAVTAATPAAPSIDSNATAYATVGSSFGYSISASNSPTSYAASSLPPGLSVSTSGYLNGTPTAAGSYSVPISATNATGTANAVLTITVADRAAPVISSDSTVRGVVGSSLSYSIYGNHSPTGYTADNLPPGLSLNTTAGYISGTPTTAGTYSVPVSASNAAGAGNAVVTFTIAATAGAPVLSGSAVASGTVGAAFSYAITASRTPTGYSTGNLPPSLNVNTTSGSISGTPTAAGVYRVPVSATNASGTANAVLTITVAATAPGVATPVVTSAAAASGTINAAFSYTITAANAPTAFDLGASLPAGLSFNAATGTISGTPTTAGVYVLPVTASNSSGSGRAKITLTVYAAPSSAPVVNSAAGATVAFGEPFSYAITGTNQPTSYAASGLPSGLTLDTSTGLISGTLTSANSSSVALTATNAIGQGKATLTLQFASPPGRFTSSLSSSGVKGTALTYAVTANLGISSYGASSLPAGLSINASTGRITGSPTASGTFRTTLSAYATNGSTINGAVTFVIAATIASSQPVLSSSVGANGTLGDPFSYTLTATNSPTSLSVSGLPSGLSFNAATGLISGIPTSSGASNVTVAATNSAGTTSGTLSLNFIYPVPRVTSAAGVEAAVGTAFSYVTTSNVTPVYSFYATNLPAGLSFSSNTATISGTPTTAGTYTVTLSASTPTGTANASLNIKVNGTATAPPLVTSAAGATGAVGAAFGYALAASNSPDGYSAISLPAGIEFDSAAGKFFGRPTAAGTFYVPVTATNHVGTSNAILTFVIAEVPRPPALDATSLAATATVGTFTVLSPIQATNTPTNYTATGLPLGLSVEPGSGTVSGTPTTEGVYQVTVSAANAGGSASAVITLTVSRGTAPVFSYLSATWSGSVGASFSQSASASSPAASYAASALPPGLYINSSTGQVLGVPTTAGRYAVSLTASNAVGTDSVVLTFLISNASAPTFSSATATATGRVGGSFSYSFYTNNSTNCSVSGLPPGLNYSVSSGTSCSVQGTPTAAGVYAVTISAINAAGTSNAVVTMTITEASALMPPVISSAAGAGGNLGVQFGYLVSATNSPTSYTASGLPDGLQFNAANGYISGVPTTTGNYPVNVSARNAGGTGSAVVTLQIGGVPPAPSAAPVISSAAAANYTGGTTNSSFYLYSSSVFNYTITADGNPTSFGATNLPPGLSVNPSTGVISGKPLTAGTFTVPVTAANGAGTGSATLTIVATATSPTVAPALNASGAVGSALSYSLAPSGDSVFYYYPYTNVVRETVAFAATGLPPGLSLDTATGAITGTPAQAGSFPVAVAATNRAGAGRAVMTFVITAAPPVVSAPPLLFGSATASGIVGAALSYNLSASNSPTSYAATGLPAGLSLNTSTGAISGIPVAEGIYGVSVTATNAAGSASATLTMAIASAPLTPVIASAAGAQATAGVAFTYAISINYTTSTPPVPAYGADHLPAGLSLNASTGFITGYPAAAGDYSIPISVRSVGVTGQATLTLTVRPAPASPAAPGAPVFTGLAGTAGFTENPFVYNLGVGGFVPDGALPTGLSYDPATGAVSGYPAATGNFDVPLAATGAGGTGHATLNLRFVAPDLSLPRIVAQPVGQTVMQGGSAALAATVAGAPKPALQWVHDGLAVPGATGSELDFAVTAPADAGSYVLNLRNSSGSLATTAAVLRVIQSYAAWQGTYFSPAEINAGLAADSADFNGDGLSNLLEYALGRDPRTGAGGSVPTGGKPPGGPLQIQFSRDSGKTDLEYLVEASPDLRVWTGIARSSAGGATSNLGGAGAVAESAGGGGTVMATVSDGQLAGAGGARFLRLRVTRQ